MIKYYYFFIINIILFAGCSSNTTPISSIYVAPKTINTVEKGIQPIETISIKNHTIAIVFPSQVIGKYAIEATNSAISYLIYKNQNFNLKVFDTIDEKPESVKNTFDKIAQEGITKVLVLLTYNGAKVLNMIDTIDEYNIYLPLIHKNYLDLHRDKIVYGSIDYTDQLKALLVHSNNKNIEFHDNSNLGYRLYNSLKESQNNIFYSKEINNKNNLYSNFINVRNRKLFNSTLIINMPIVKSSIILSQLNAHNINTYKILSTQLNYTPLLLSLTQVDDRANIILANSIEKINNIVEEYNSFLETNIIYNWVNYSTTIGIEYLVSNNLSKFNSILIERNQIKYPVKLYTTTKYSFEPLE